MDNSRFYEKNFTYNRENSWQKHRESGLITGEDERLVRRYVDELIGSRGIGQIRANKLAFTLNQWRRFLPVEYRELRIEDVYRGITSLKTGKSIKGKPFKQDTLHDYVVILKAFSLWMIESGYNERLPEKKVRQIKAPRMDYNVTLPQDLPSMEEMVEIIRYCPGSMEKAFVAATYESSARVGETARLTWNNLVRDEFGYTVHIDDQKEGLIRFGRLIMCTEYLNTYRNLRPGAGKDDFVFTMENGLPLKYSKAHRIIRDAIQAAIDRTENEDIRKSLAGKVITPHDLRRARITHMILQGYPETAIKMLAWGNLNTQQFRVYVKLCEKDLDRIYLEKAGMVRSKDELQVPTAPRPCIRCGTVNGCGSDFCSKCGRPLTEAKINELASAEDEVDQDPRFRAWMKKVHAEAKQEFRKMMSART